ncbi:MAG: D-glucuronyl C5-epimerase family protein [Ktedonobacteraceae bacterium]
MQKQIVRNNSSLISPDLSNLVQYPFEVSLVFVMKRWTLDSRGIPFQDAAGYDPTLIACYALMQWNNYLASGGEKSYVYTFLLQVQWLLDHVEPIGSRGSQENELNASGWPLLAPSTSTSPQRVCLSALTQSVGLSVLIRAFQLTGDQDFLDGIQRVIRTFERDILDGGVYAPICNKGVCFEETAVYPAAHVLRGHIFALLGLHDYLQFTQDTHFEGLIQRGHETLHELLDEWESGSWTYTNLLDKELATPEQHNVHVALLEALARIVGCEHCAQVAEHWKTSSRRPTVQLRYLTANLARHLRRNLHQLVQKALFPQPHPASMTRVCIAVPAFPVMGGVLTFLEKVILVSKKSWQREYVTQHIGPDPYEYFIHRFGTRRMTPWYFPFVWLYVLSGWGKLISLLRHGAGYTVIMPQDGIYTGAFAGLAGKLAGVRVVCIDHGDLSLLQPRNNQIYRYERLEEVAAKNWPWLVRLAASLLLALYWPSRWLLAWIAAHCVDHYLIPGIPEDGVNDICKELGVPASRITRFANMIEIERHVIPDAETMAVQRRKNGIPVGATLIAIVCRLSSEKGLEIAIEAISQALAALSERLAENVIVIIVGDGPQREQLARNIERHKLSGLCMLWGEASMDEVIAILGISDIFLYTSTRGAGYPLAIMEAMASSCAVVASTEPAANTLLLAEGRGIPVPVGDVAATSAALVRLLTHPEQCRSMGEKARAYIAAQHTPEIFWRTLLRVTGWSGLRQLLSDRKGDQYIL